jgi:hypothetical protein
MHDVWLNFLIKKKTHTHTHTKHEACKCIENNQHCPRDAVVGQAE